MKLLVGFDGSDGADDAVELARRLAGGERGEVLLLNVLPYPGPLPAAYYLLGYDEEEWSRDLFEEPAAKLAPLTVHWAKYVGGSAAHVLTDRAAEEDFDLMVVGSPHRGAAGRALLGSVAEGVLHGAPVPVAVAPRGCAGATHDEVRRIAVAYDGSPEADVALRQAEAFARHHGATLELLTVATAAPPTPSLVGFRFDPVPTPGEVLEQGLAALGDDVAATGRELHAGSVAEALAAACGEVDLLVVGSRGYGFLGRVLAGSVSTELIRSAPCPVLVAPRPAEGDGA